MTDGKNTPRFFIRYVFIGALVTAVDFGAFSGLLRTGIPLAAAFTTAYCVGVAMHFTLNRVLNFRNFQRAVYAQLRTYIIIAIVSWGITLGFTEVGFRYLGLSPLVSKLLAIGLNLPIGFMGHRHLTFGPGIGSAAVTYYLHLRGTLLKKHG